MLKILAFFYCVIMSHSQIIVDTQYGQIIGAENLSALNTTYLSFQGIPYMRPPV